MVSGHYCFGVNADTLVHQSTHGRVLIGSVHDLGNDRNSSEAPNQIRVRQQTVARAGATSFESHRLGAQHQVREVDVPRMRRHVRALGHVAHVAQVTVIDHFPVVGLRHTVDLHRLGVIDEIEQRRESIAQAEAVASRANTILSKNELSVGGSVAVVNDDLCATCLTCVRTCPYHVPRILDRAAHIEVAQCQGCGICASECPNKAIQLLHYTDEQVVAKVESFEVEEENGLISNAKAQSSNEIPSSNG